MFGKICLDGLEILNFIFVDDDPDDSEVHVEIAHDFSPRDHLGDGVVSHCHVRLVRTERDGTKQSVLSVGVLE